MFGQETPAQNFVKKKNLQTTQKSQKMAIYSYLQPKNGQKWPVKVEKM